MRKTFKSRKSVIVAAIALAAAGCNSPNSGGHAKQVPSQPGASVARVTPPSYSPAGPVARARVSTPAPAVRLVSSPSSSSYMWNATCPVLLGNPVDPRINSDWNGHVIAFSSTTAKLMWDADPSRYASNLTGVYDSSDPKGSWGSSSDAIARPLAVAPSAPSAPHPVLAVAPAPAGVRVVATPPCAAPVRAAAPAPCGSKPAPVIVQPSPCEPVIGGECDECPGGNCRIPGR